MDKSEWKNFLDTIRKKGRSPVIPIGAFQEDAVKNGLEDDIIDTIIDVITHTDLGAAKWISLIKCMVPKYKFSEQAVKDVISWYVTSANNLPVTVSTTILQWIIGICDYQLVDRKVINMFYDVFFYMMLKRERLEKHLVRLIYMLTKPEDVSRRNVCRLLTLQQKYQQPQKHIVALLSLFKSYKPELVPEKIKSINIDSVWRQIPEVLRVAFEDAKDRADVQQSRMKRQEYFDWNMVKPLKLNKKPEPLIPSVGYFHFGSNIFKEKDGCSVFNVSTIEDLGKYQLSIDLPCNAISLLSNMAGYHLLTFADIQYQSRFSYNLYNTFKRAFLLENGKFPKNEMDSLLDMTAEFSCYMQQGIHVVTLFLDEYLHVETGEYREKLLPLLQWMISTPIGSGLQENILKCVQNIYYESPLIMKCEIIKTFAGLIRNFYVNQGFSECRQTKPASFLKQEPIDSLDEVIPVLTKIASDLIVSGLNIHSYDLLILSEALAFYEQVCLLQRSSDELIWTVAPPAVIYGGFLTRNCGILSRTCKLLLEYGEMILQFKGRQEQSIFKEKVYTITIYAQDIVTALWYNEPFSSRENGYLLKNLSNKVIKDLEYCDMNSLLSLENHYAILPYKISLCRTGLDISTKEAAFNLANCYYPAVSEFVATFKG